LFFIEGANIKKLFINSKVVLFFALGDGLEPRAAGFGQSAMSFRLRAAGFGQRATSFQLQTECN
jgi:hypothetical protein